MQIEERFVAGQNVYVLLPNGCNRPLVTFLYGEVYALYGHDYNRALPGSNVYDENRYAITPLVEGEELLSVARSLLYYHLTTMQPEQIQNGRVILLKKNTEEDAVEFRFIPGDIECESDELA